MKIEELRANIDKSIMTQLHLFKDVYTKAIADKEQVGNIEIWAKQITILIKAYHECCAQEIIELEKLTEDIITDHLFAIQMQKDQDDNEDIFENGQKDPGKGFANANPTESR